MNINLISKVVTSMNIDLDKTISNKAKHNDSSTIDEEISTNPFVKESNGLKIREIVITPPPMPTKQKTPSKNLKAKKKHDALEFRGDTIGYFKIWIINVLFSIVTLGIYSAWAKVRTNRYFYTNTFYKDKPFKYDANPISILIDRVLIVLLVGAFIYSFQFLQEPIITLSIVGVTILTIPWIITRAVKSNLRALTYKDINFICDIKTKELYRFFLTNTLLNIATVGLAYPYTLNKFNELIISNGHYDTEYFRYMGTNNGIYSNFFATLKQSLLLGIGLMLVGIGVLYALDSMKIVSENNEITILYITYAIIFLCLKAIYDATIQKFIWKNISLGKIKFRAKYNSKDLMWIYCSNILVLILSFGLLYPWTKVRVKKYKTQNFKIKDNKSK